MPAHTPVNYLKAGDMGGFSAQCINALADAGLSPDDFGSHDYVQQRIRAARQRVKQAKKDGKTPDPHDEFLAQSQSGHATPSELMSPKRGDACKNYQPPNGDARGFQDNMAPCFPTPNNTSANTRGDRRGSPHWAVCENEQNQIKNLPKGQTVGANQMSTMAQENAGIATARPGKNTQYDAQLNGLRQERTDIDNEAAKRKVAMKTNKRLKAPYTKQMKKDKQAATVALTRGDELAKTRDASAKSLPRAATDPNGGTIDGNDAAECIEKWRQAAMTKMKTNAAEKYGEKYDQTLKDAQAAQKKAEADNKTMRDALDGPRKAGPNGVPPAETKAQAQARQKAARPAADALTQQRLQDRANDPTLEPSVRKEAADTLADPKKMRGAPFQEATRTRMDLDAANAELNNAPCLNQQVRSQCGLPTPPQGGFTPSVKWPPAVTSQPEGFVP
jgi:hypothetical protein